MDRTSREGRRTGGGGGSISAPRRPRTTGFKDSPVRDDDEMMDEVHNSRLRERNKKDSLVSVNPGTALRNKRKRQEMQVPAHSSAADEVDESTDETDGGVSEEDDDPPPPIPRWSGKPRPSKFAEEGIGLDLPAVPRKARSAIVKRHQESPQPLNATTPPHHSPSTPAPSNTPSSSSAAAKPGRRMKPNGSKPRPAKVPKSSSAPISEQEVEVAEALFDLHRMVPNFQKVSSDSKLDARTELKPERVSASPVRAPSPAQTASTALLSPSSASPFGPTNTLASGGSHPAEAPKRKRPRIRPRSEEGGAVASVRPATNVGPGASVSQKGEHEQGSRNSSVDRTAVKTDSAAKLPGPNSASTAPTGIFQATGVSNSPSSGQTLPDHHDGQTKKAEVETKPNSSERKSALGDSITPVLNANSDLAKRKFPPVADIRPAKFEIDLMAPPTSSLPIDLMESSADIDRKETVDLQGGSSELSWLEKERERRDKEAKEKEEQRDLKTEENDMKKEPDLQKEMLKDERECLDLNKHGMPVLRSAKGPRVDGKTAQKPDRSVSAAVVSAASSFLNATASASTSTPTPMSMTSWPGGLPSVGYYGPAAAAVAAAAAVVSWPQGAAAASLSGTSAEENNPSHAQMVPYSTGRQSWKRCAIHVFIARFIDLQQQMARHSLMAATYGASAYGGKPYNLNIPADNVFGNGAISVSGVPSTNTVGSNVSTGLPLGAISGVSANAQGSKNGPYMEALFRKHPAQQQQQHAVQGPAFGFPVTQSGGSMPSSATAPANSVGASGNALSSASTGSGGNSSPAVAAGNSSVASMAAQAQFFQAVMQHNAFPFPFPASHFGSHNFNGGQNLGQQAAQFVNNPFYTHLVHPPQPQQQGQATSSVLSGTSQKPQQQGGRIFSNLGSAQQQQFSSPSAYNSPQQNLTGGEKEASTHREAGDTKIPSFQRLIFSQQSANSGAPNLNVPPSSVHGTDVPSGPQDFSSLAGKHVGKSPVLQQGSSQHSGIPSQLHQAAGQHGGIPTLQMNLKNLDSQSSQVSSSMSTVTRGSVGPGPLGLAPVAAVMAPQGHAVLQNMADQARLLSQHQHNQSQPHLHSMQQGQQQPRSLQRVPVDELSEGNNQGNADERKLSAKRGSTISRVDLESLPSMQGSPTSGNSSSRMGNPGPAMNLLAPAGSISSRLNAHPSQGAGASVQSPSQNAKQGAVRAKAPLTSVSASAVTSFGDRTAMNRVSGPGMSFPAQGGMPNLQGSKQGQVPVSQHQQLKLSQRPSVAPVPGTSVLAAAMSKNQVQPSRSPQGSVNIAAAPRIPVSSAPPATASPKQGSVTQKNAAKGSFPLSQKPSVASGKRSPANPSSSTLLNSSSTSQNQSTKTMQPQQQLPQPSQQASSPQQATAQQYQAHLSQQQANHMQKQPQQAQVRQQQMFFQQQYLQQPQQHLTVQQQGLVQQQLAQSHPQASQQQQTQLQGTTSPSANGLLGSQGLPLGPSSNGTSGRTAPIDSSFSQGMMSKSAPATRTASVSPVTSMSSAPQRVSGMPVLHQTGSPNTNQQQSSNFPVAHAYSSGGTSVKSSEQKNDATPEQSNNLRATAVSSTQMPSTLVSSPMKTSSMAVSGFPNQAPGRQQPVAPGAGKSVNYGEGGMVPRVPSSTASAGQSSSLPTPNSSSSSAPTYNGAGSSDVRVNFVTSTGMHQQSPASSHQPSMSLVAATPIAVAASSGTPGLLGQSSASALRP